MDEVFIMTADGPIPLSEFYAIRQIGRADIRYLHKNTGLWYPSEPEPIKESSDGMALCGYDELEGKRR